jgi:hypothetical protein
MIVGGYAINMREEVATATMVKWLVLEGVVVVVGNILGKRVRRLRAHHDLSV